MNNDIIENNKLIAEFMGIEFNSFGDKCNHPLISAAWPPVECLQYNKSWIWLMPVVEKIESLDFVVQMHLGSCFIKRQEQFIAEQAKYISKYQGKSKIEAVYKSIIEFIKWFNDNHR